MKWFSFVTGVLLAMLLVSPTYAQQPGTPTDHPAASVTTTTTPETAAPAGMPMMDMCRQMMGNGMGMPMMGAGSPTDPKEKAEMMQMRGEMMKAMGDIMMKHARHMQGPTPK